MQSQPKTPAALSFAVLLILTAATCVCAQSSYFKNWPAGASPREVGTRVARNYLARQFEYQQGKRPYVIYPEVCAGYGSLTVAQLTKNKDLKNQLLQKFETLWSEEGQKHVSSQAHVDYRVFGVVPLQLYMQTSEQKFLDLGRSLADLQWGKTTPDGITAEARYWIDDMYFFFVLAVFGAYKRNVKEAPDRDGPTGRIKFGTESNGGFKNITISNIVFDHCRGLALEAVDGGVLEDITISNITMRDIVNSPIFLRLGSRMRGPGRCSGCQTASRPD